MSASPVTPNKAEAPLTVGGRVRHTRTKSLGVCVGQPDGDPIVKFDDRQYSDVYYRSEIEAI